MFLPERLPDLLFSHFFRIFTRKVRFWTPPWRPAGPQMATQIGIFPGRNRKFSLGALTLYPSWRRRVPHRPPKASQRPPKAPQISFLIDFGMDFGRVLVDFQDFAEILDGNLATVSRCLPASLCFPHHAFSGRCPWGAAVTPRVDNQRLFDPSEERPQELEISTLRRPRVHC